MLPRTYKKEVLQFRIDAPLYAELKRFATAKKITISQAAAARIKAAFEWDRALSSESGKHIGTISAAFMDLMQEAVIRGIKKASEQ